MYVHRNATTYIYPVCFNPQKVFHKSFSKHHQPKPPHEHYYTDSSGMYIEHNIEVAYRTLFIILFFLVTLLILKLFTYYIQYPILWYT